MSVRSGLLSRRAALAGLRCRLCASLTQRLSDSAAADDGGPVFSPSGPNAELYGAAQGFPVPIRSWRGDGQSL